MFKFETVVWKDADAGVMFIPSYRMWTIFILFRILTLGARFLRLSKLDYQRVNHVKIWVVCDSGHMQTVPGSAMCASGI